MKSAVNVNVSSPHLYAAASGKKQIPRMIDASIELTVIIQDFSLHSRGSF
ncbi:hypothetical protein [Holdemania massiliensis]|nr:hypothetical protein [Holdemania massiliensis]